MSTIPPTSATTATNQSQSASNPAAILGQDGFLKLLVAEMQNQDPMSSSQDPTQTVTQMAQFSSVEQLTNLVQSSQQAQSIALIGHTVAYTDAAGNAGQGVVEDAEARRRRPAGIDQRRGEVDQLHPEAQVGLVRAEALDGLGEGQAREGHLLERPLGHDRGRDPDHQVLDKAGDRGLVDEAHLQVELGELWLPVAAGVLIAEAARDLEVAVEPADHQQLLELLRTLGQGVDGARLEP